MKFGFNDRQVSAAMPNFTMLWYYFQTRNTKNTMSNTTGRYFWYRRYNSRALSGRQVCCTSSTWLMRITATRCDRCCSGRMGHSWSRQETSSRLGKNHTPHRVQTEARREHRAPLNGQQCMQLVKTDTRSYLQVSADDVASIDRPINTYTLNCCSSLPISTFQTTTVAFR